MNFRDKLDDAKRKYLFMAIGAACLIIALSSVLLTQGRGHTGGTARETTVAPDEFADEGETKPDTWDNAAPWKIYITGEVPRPGVYEIAAGSRVADALWAAGGFSSRADTEAVNLAEVTADGAHIRIPRMQTAEERASSSYAPQSAQTAASGTAKNAQSGTAGAAERATGERPTAKAASAKNAQGEIININTAAADELRKLPGIGPKLSQSIVEYRETNGRFNDKADIMKVGGIGRKRFEAIKDLITVVD
ncbi:hypothetical protein FACS1894216_20300 [Synergistales bacterium]|nr:hypothetical protein FACS1894216_20300 [Synergistales bacterium]